MVQKIYYSIAWMLISPVLVLILALKNGNRRYVRWVLFLFTVVYGSTWGIEGIGDGTRHWQNVYLYYTGLSFAGFWNDLVDIVLFRTNLYVNEDVYIHVISYLTGGVLQMPGIFFVVVAIVYGYFFAGSMVKVFEVFPTYRRSLIFFSIAILFIMYLNIQSMNTVRTWTGFWILFYACINYYQTKNKKYLWLMFLPPFFHYGYFLMAVPAWIVAFLGNRKIIYTALFFMSFTFTILNPQMMVDQLSQFEVGEDAIRGYYVEEQRAIGERIEISQDTRWYLQYHRSGIVSWGIVGLTALFIIKGRYFREFNRLESSLFSTGILTKALSNSTWFFYAVANRSNAIAILFILAAVLIFWQRKYREQGGIWFTSLEKGVLTLICLTFVPYYVYILANVIEYMSVFIFLFPFLAWISEDVRTTVRELIGYFL